MRLADENQSDLEAEFEAAANDPHGLDCGFEAQRCGTGFANFGTEPDKAAEMREKELARIAAELEAEVPDYDADQDDDGLFTDDDDFGDDEPLPDLGDEEFTDRFENSVGLPELDDGDEWK